VQKNIVVTGGFGALGRAVVADLISRGHAVAIVDIAPVAADSPTKIAVGGVDLANEKAVESAYAELASQLGSIDGLVNIAGGFVWEPMESGTLESWDNMYRMNLRTAVVSSRAALPYLLKTGGAVVNVGAAAAANPGMGMAPYAASKAGVVALTVSLAEEFKGRGVRFNAVLPTIIDTPTNRRDMPDADTSAWVKPEAAAKVIAFLLSEESGSVTGETIRLSLGT
jgi:NAD(P)-dependent dehydrogenase (short-subunit alcohol dehydrogenase family)